MVDSKSKAKQRQFNNQFTEEGKMEFKIEGVQQGNEYKHFKAKLEAISGRVNVKYDYIKKIVSIGYEEPYLIDNITLQHKSDTKKEILKEITALRQIQ